METVLFQMSTEPSDLADGIMSGHLVKHPASLHLPKTKKKKGIYDKKPKFKKNIYTVFH